ncbi:hypothetical protein [Allorhizocola rhizosphaerae]|uniref:hypothetical protein n=1 Tax=Allorhizocola rhizosphaerae TaxID=1872709 RepID=UPI000E3B6B97|nr:hypothetical protein [Allorhizocola rhizosphaerae]
MASLFSWRSLLIGLASMALAACGSVEPPKRVEPPADIPAVVDVLTLVLPLDAYLPDATKGATVKRAEQILFQRCMGRFGWNLELPPAPAPMPFKRNERRYGVSADRAKKYGYHTPEVDARSAAGMAGEPQLSEQALAVAEGTVTQYSGSDVPPGGCHGEADSRLAEGTQPVADMKLAEKLASRSFSESREDSRVLQAFANWSACMKRSGYSYRDPLAALADRSFRTPSATPAEIQTSVTDAQCKTETRLVEIWAGVEAAYQMVAIETNAVALQAIAELESVRSQNAVRIVQAGS